MNNIYWKNIKTVHPRLVLANRANIVIGPIQNTDFSIASGLSVLSMYNRSNNVRIKTLVSIDKNLGKSILTKSSWVESIPKDRYKQ